MINFEVKEDKCINCGICSAECPVLIINKKTPFPTIKDGKEGNCLKCQHCLAVCPEGAISILGKSPENSIPTSASIPASVDMENLMKIRRSIRRFKQDDVDKELIHHLIEAASYAPTAKNENAVQFTVVDTREQMNKLRDMVYAALKTSFDEGRLPAAYMYLNNFRQVWEAKQIDVIFRDAPHVLILSAPKQGTEPLVDATIATTYFDLLASANGLGTLWDGFAKNAFVEAAPELQTMIGLPEDHEVATIILFGKPGRKFARSIQNDEPAIVSLSL